MPIKHFDKLSENNCQDEEDSLSERIIDDIGEIIQDGLEKIMGLIELIFIDNAAIVIILIMLILLFLTF